jgi:hypothetical protein
MIGVSLAGLVGALIGTAVAAIVYGRLVQCIERGVRSVSMRQREPSESEISLLRRVVLAADIAVLGGAGYWLGAAIWG